MKSKAMIDGGSHRAELDEKKACRDSVLALLIGACS